MPSNYVVNYYRDISILDNPVPNIFSLVLILFRGRLEETRVKLLIVQTGKFRATNNDEKLTINQLKMETNE